MAELGWVLAVRVVHVGCTVEIDGPYIDTPRAALYALEPVGYTAARQPNLCQKVEEKVHCEAPATVHHENTSCTYQYSVQTQQGRS